MAFLQARAQANASHNNALNYRSLRSLDVQKLRFWPPVSLIVRQAMSSRIKKSLAIVLALYAITGIIAWNKEAGIMSRKALEGYDRALKLQEKFELECIAKGTRSSCTYNIAYVTGPNWSVTVVPVLPGVSLIDSAYYVGPKWAEGSARIELWYGFGSFILHDFGSWVS